MYTHALRGVSALVADGWQEVASLLLLLLLFTRCRPAGAQHRWCRGPECVWSVGADGLDWLDTLLPEPVQHYPVWWRHTWPICNSSERQAI
jgi:hypothetical protein